MVNLRGPNRQHKKINKYIYIYIYMFGSPAPHCWTQTDTPFVTQLAKSCGLCPSWAHPPLQTPRHMVFQAKAVGSSKQHWRRTQADISSGRVGPMGDAAAVLAGAQNMGTCLVLLPPTAERKRTRHLSLNLQSLVVFVRHELIHRCRHHGTWSSKQRLWDPVSSIEEGPRQTSVFAADPRLDLRTVTTTQVLGHLGWTGALRQELKA